ncbi:MAG: hypothetical protein DI562_12245 [Stenotrophomonas acidaminiphila]|nr:MAG: hypothetical protein DI562_12245 [Stenotrophomonas acidaminiphila]
MYGNANVRRGGPLRRHVVWLALAWAAALPTAWAGEIEQGVLLLRWGDARPAAPGQAGHPPRFKAWLDAGPGAHRRLDVAQATRAAGDLYALANRRVAVSHAAAGKRGSRPVIDAIVPVDHEAQRAQVEGDDGRPRLAAPVHGSTRWITLMCRFADMPAEPKSRDFFQSQYGDAPGQLGHYWSQVSQGAIDLAGSQAYGWYALPRPRSAYTGAQADLSLLFADCVAAADGEVDFTGAMGVNLMFNEELDGYAWGGGACASFDGAYGCLRATWNPPWAFLNLAALAHEMGHGYGLPHSDNSDGDADTYDNPWDLMSDAWRHAGSDPVYGLLPKYINACQRGRLGWVAPAGRLTVQAEDIGTHDVMLDTADTLGGSGVQLLVLALPTQPDPFATVVYIVEARRRTTPYESNLAGDAVIIHALRAYGTTQSLDSDVPPATYSANEGSMLRPGERFRLPQGQHQVDVIAATATGFLVRVGPVARVMSSPLPALVRAESGAAVSSPSRPLRHPHADRQR